MWPSEPGIRRRSGVRADEDEYSTWLHFKDGRQGADEVRLRVSKQSTGVEREDDDAVVPLTTDELLELRPSQSILDELHQLLADAADVGELDAVAGVEEGPHGAAGQLDLDVVDGRVRSRWHFDEERRPEVRTVRRADGT